MTKLEMVKTIKEIIEYRKNPYTTWIGLEEKFSMFDKWSTEELEEKLKIYSK